MDAPGRITTARLVLARPCADDAEAIFATYAADPVATRWMGWPTHRSLDDTRAFLAFAEGEWATAGVGTYLIRDPGGALLGSTGLHLETPWRAVIGYILAVSAWGQGLATEATQAMIALADASGVRRVQADVHPDNAASRRVLAKCGLVHEGTRRAYGVMPNLGPAPCDLELWARVG